MEASSVRAFRRNLEPFEDDRVAGPWRVAGYTDLVSERRYLVSRASAESATRVDADVFRYRCEAAAAIAPEACAAAIDVVVDGTRVEILSAYAAPLSGRPWDDASITALLSELMATLRRFEAHLFFAIHLAPATIGRDESGGLQILPAAVAFPHDLPDANSTPDVARTRGRAAHLAALVAVADVLATHATGPLATRLRAFAAAGSPSLDAAAEHLLGTGPARAYAAPPGPATAPETDLSEAVRAVAESRVVEITGPAGSGRSALLDRLAAALCAAGMDAQFVDEWDLTAPPRRRGTGKELPRPSVWLVDDADERNHLHAALLDYATELDRRPETGLVVVTRADRDPAGAVLTPLRLRAARGTHLLTTVAFDRAGHEVDLAARLDTLETEARQVLDLVAVAGIPLPLEVVLSMFPGSERAVHRHAHALAGLGLMGVELRRLPPNGTHALSLRIPAASMRRQIVERIPESRRRNLHRTVARIAETRGTFPPMLACEQLLLADEFGPAATRAAAFVKESTRTQRAPFLDLLRRLVANGEAVRSLRFGDHLALLVRIGDDLITRGRPAEAEEFLTRARDLHPGSDELRAHAPLACEALRLLADAWASRGLLREALELLEDAREDVAPYLSLAEQARLLNDIGWLQYRLGDYSGCVDSCKFTSTTLNPNEHPTIVAQALNLLGVIAFNTSRYDEAISYYEQSAFLRERENDLNALSGSYNNLALAYQARNEYDKALGYLHRSIEIKRRQNNEAGLAGGYMNLALLYLEVHNFDEAEKRCRESLRISSQLGLAQLVAENHNTMGDIVLTRGQLDEAEAFYRLALEHAQRLSTVNEEMGAQKRLAKLYLRKARHHDARTAIDAASRLAQQVGSRYEQAQTEEILGDLRAAENGHEEAVDHFEKATTLYATLSKQRLAAACLAKAGLAHARSGNALDAKRYLDRAQDLIKPQVGQEIPEEIVTLKQTLRENPLPSGATGTESQKLLYAFYELASLSDYADDKGAIVRRIITVFQDLAGAARCSLALRAEDGGFASVNVSGEVEPVTDTTTQAVLARALQLGTLVHCASPEIKDLLANSENPDPETRLVIVPMKSMGKDLGCVVLNVPPDAVPQSREDQAFVACLARHVAGALRLSLHMAERSRTEQTLDREFESLGAPAADGNRFQSLIGRDESMRKVFRVIDKVKDMDTGILIFGESGTGKTELARTIHHHSPRRRHVFQSIHCAEIPASLLESELFGHERGAFTGAVQRKLGRCEIADGGTVFLDDVNVMPPDTQARLLHYLETKSFTRLGGTQKIITDVRLIAASNEDLERLVKEGRFREDLFYRLKVIQIELPPLRERRDDLILIAQEFLKKRCHAQGKALKRLSSETITLFHQYRWPGNVRELQNVLEQIVLLCDDDLVEPSSLPEDFLRRAADGGRSRWQSLEQLAQQMVESGNYSASNPLMPQIEAMLASKMAAFTGTKAKAAGLLGITKPTLYTRLRGYERLK